MKKFIKILGNSFLLSTELLGLKEAQLWIGGSPDGPKDDDDERVFRKRVEAEARKNQPDQRISGIEALNLCERVRYRGYFEIEVIGWTPGIYRLMLHSKAQIQAPNGTLLRPGRDLQYSWPIFPDEYLMNLSAELQKFLYLEPNGRGFCIRIEVTKTHEIKPAGNGEEWIPRWPEIKKEIESHIKKKIRG